MSPRCANDAVLPRAVSGRGTVMRYAVNHQAWATALRDPFVVATVELAEQPGLRLRSNVVGCAPEALHTTPEQLAQIELTYRANAQSCVRR